MRQRQITDEVLRRKLHNTVQDLKGNVRVICRVRPRAPEVQRTNAHFSALKGGSILDAINLEQPTRLSLTANYVPGQEQQEQGGLVPMATVAEGGEQALRFEHVVEPGGEDLAETLQVEVPKVGVDGTRSKTLSAFKFDKVFTEASDQQDIFDHLSGLVTSCIDGYNVTVFAYGQTGSGKTHTMIGPDSCIKESVDAPAPASSQSSKWHKKPVRSNPQRGIIPRTLEQILGEVQELETNGWAYTLHASFLEIYNETIRDLLHAGDEAQRPACKIVNHAKAGRMEVSGVSKFAVHSVGEINELLEQALAQRSVGKTACNHRSSRSHTVFRLELAGVHQETGEKKASELSLVDLAGSERLSESKVTGKQREETTAINKSLSALGGCITAIANKQKHVPVRESTLTQLLQHSLGGT
jgi:kinesin family protein C1